MKYLCYNMYMGDVIYTIGYTSFSIDDFLLQLKLYNIHCLIDVRSNPVASEYYQIYSKNTLEPILNKNKIYYRNYAREFGARQTDLLFYSNNQLDFQKFVNSQNFIDGVEKIKKGMALGYNFVLMCAEKDPINCHRAIMVGKGLRDQGLSVNHILSDKSIITQNDIETRLLNLYFPNRSQLSLFECKNDEILLEEAYALQNKKIGYKIEELAS